MEDEARQRAYRRPALTVWRYDTPLGADAGAVRLKGLQDLGALTVHDAITVGWLPGTHRPRIAHLRHGAASDQSSVLGALVGRLVRESAPAAAAAALAGRLRGTGIDQEFLEEVLAHLEPGSSALLVLSSDADLDHVRPVVERGIARGDVLLLHAQLVDDAAERLRAVVADLDPADDRAGRSAGPSHPKE